MRWPLTRLLPAETHFNFVRLAPFAAILSALAVLGSIGSFVVLGLNLGVDFAGGNTIQVQTRGPAPFERLRVVAQQARAADVEVQQFGANNSATVKFRSVTDPATNKPLDPTQSVAKVQEALTGAFPGLAITRVAAVGPKVSGELFGKGLVALGTAMGLMLLYIWFRFQLQFGLGAVIAILHDVLLTMGILSAMQIEFSMTSIAALLTVIGYSMNEKVITFDRLRENLRKYKKRPLAEVINLSENERLSRTLITGSTALLALVGALFWGGPALFPLVFAMVFGILIGTYSSIYVALPVILLWGVKRDDEAAKAIDWTPAGRGTKPIPRG
jgi:preprotein translocase subunit SecF